MENRINIKMIGVGFIIVLSITIGLLFWIHRATYNACSEEYHIYFDRSVSGLRIGDLVVYNGIRSGRVLEIKRDTKDIQKTIVRICIEKNFPLKEDAYATIESKSITGGSVINIRPGSNDAPILKRTGKTLPIISSHPSTIDQVIKSLPKVLNTVSLTFTKINSVLDKNTQKNIQGSIKNFKGILKQTNQIIQSKDKAIRDILDLAALNLSKFSKIQSFIIDNEYSINTFLSTGMLNFSKFMENGAESMSSLRQILNALEKSPGRFLHNDSAKGVTLK